MITGEILQKAKDEWGSYLKPLKELSKNKRGKGKANGESKEKSLIDSDIQMFDYDAITRAVHASDNCPSSTDVLFIAKSGNEIEFIEFKTGFKQKITKENWVEEKGKCPKFTDGAYTCRDYWDLFWKNQKAERKILIDSIRLKAVESYLTLEKKILPVCPKDDNNRLKIKLTIVIDEDGEENLEDMYKGISNVNRSEAPNDTKVEDEKNCFESIRRALKRLHLQKDSNGHEYFYDEVRVLSATQFMYSLKSYR